MKKIRARKKFLRINTPMSFGILCAVLLLLLAGGGYALASGVIIPVAERIEAANATPTPTPTVTPEVVTPGPTPSPVPTPEVLTTIHPFTGEVLTMSPTPEATAEPEETPGPLTGKTIAIDAGKSKGGTHRGVKSRTYEYKINYAFAVALKEELIGLGAEVVMTRDSESKVVGADARIRTINNSKADVVISLFCNDHDSGSINGAEAYVPKKSSHADADAKLARAVLNGYTTATGMEIRENDHEGNVRLVTNKDVLNGSKKPVMGLVLGQLSNRSDDENLNDKDFIAKAARGIASGIRSYFAS